ncbi:MAG: DNA-binding response OmpR family regulator [Acidimicrobiales bacterium]|jgi:DNA-binding response OmpR family regulator
MKKVLVIEDERSLRNVIRDALENKNYQVLEAEDGKIGLDLALKEKPEVILLDLKMPNLGGQEMLKRLRLDPWGKKATVIVMTNQDDVNNVGTAHEVGITEYILKSDMDLEELLKKVRNTILMES